MSGGVKLERHTIVHRRDPKSGVVTESGVFGPGDEMPDWAVAALGGETEKAKASRRSSGPDGSLPPKSGNGSGKDAWLAYARTDENAAKLAAAEVGLADDANRDEIIAALTTAGVPTEKTPDAGDSAGGGDGGAAQ